MRFKTIALLFLILLPLSVAGQTDPGAKYIGYEYKGVIPEKMLPNGVQSLGGGIIGDVYADPVYEVAQLKKGKTTMLWLNVSTGQDKSGVTGWKVLDVISFPNLLKTDYLYFYGDPGIECRRNGKDIVNLVGVGRVSMRQGIFRPSKLWVASLITKKFEPEPVVGVKCQAFEP